MSKPHVVVAGSGIAGLLCALHASATCEVTLISKGPLELSNTSLAQGGIAAAIFDRDSPGAHALDTERAGAGLCDREAVRVLCTEGPERIADLLGAGVAFDTDAAGLAGGLEAAHSHPRILHAGGDATGAHITAALIARLRAHGQVRVLEHTFLTEIRTERGRVRGVQVITAPPPVAGRQGRSNRGSAAATQRSVSQRSVSLFADAVVLATGGAGQLYAHSSNPLVATGDGVALALRAGARTADLEFYQFHPTTSAIGGFLISEAVRGEGAVLLDASGRRFMPAAHPDAELAPRDVVARAVAAQMATQGGAPVLLDATALAARLPTRFPSIHAAVLATGLDWRTEPVPITPAAHYAMGGVSTDLDGRTSVPGLYAIGEVARTGVHGANRLASNSLLEGAVFAHRAATALANPSASWPAAPASWPSHPGSGAHASGAALFPAGATDTIDPASTASNRPFSRDALQHLMWDAVGLVRTAGGLRTALGALDAWSAAMPPPRTIAEHEDANLLLLARAAAAAALARPGSVGAHYRADSPDAARPNKPSPSPTDDQSMTPALMVT
ncbi:L-aspartate oxidase [Pseudactinotalea sp. Z1748]|uniref:L-aspartate oxidase n=1 Tax=Pseudactinotalea sp. Z1748 TaxID=3413027 RepID=UPI003C7B87E1